jgi:hypothetical protein
VVQRGGARFAWYTAVIAIVLGHIMAIYIAHVIALRPFEGRPSALRSVDRGMNVTEAPRRVGET